MKRSSMLKRRLTLVTLFFLVLIATTPPGVFALPSGPNIVHGTIQVQNSGQLQQILQSSPQGIINWNSFNISPGELVKIIQPGASSVLLNRVIGRDPSTIFGTLQANGRVFLVNPNGILFGPNSRVDAGSFVASTLGLSDKDFLKGQYTFAQNPQANLAAIVHQGEIRVSDGGFVVLAAPLLHNDGLIVARQGTVQLAAAQKATLQLDPQGLWQVVVPDGFQPGFSNPQADGRAVVLQPGQVTDVLSSVVKSGSILEASSLEPQGEQVLARNSSGLLLNSGEIRVDGGTIRLNSERASLNAPGALLSALGQDRSAGEVFLLSNGATVQAGTIDVRGLGSADGGFTEVSGRTIGLQGPILLEAQNGQAGSLLLDPVVLTLVPTGGSWDATFGGTQNVPAGGSIGADTLSLQAINSVTAGNIVIQASNDIIYNDPAAFNISLPDAVSIALDAGRDIKIGDTVRPTSINIKAGSVNISAGNNIQLSSSGPLNLLSNTSVGNVDLLAGSNVNLIASTYNINSNRPLNASGIFNFTQVAPGTSTFPTSINGTAGVNLNLGFIAAGNPVRSVNTNGPLNVLINQGTLSNVNLNANAININATNSSSGGGLFDSNVTAPSIFIGAPLGQLATTRVNVNSSGSVQLQAGNVSNPNQIGNLRLDRTTITAGDVQLLTTQASSTNMTNSNITAQALNNSSNFNIRGQFNSTNTTVSGTILTLTTQSGASTSILAGTLSGSQSLLIDSLGQTIINGTSTVNSNISGGNVVLRADTGNLRIDRMQGRATNYQLINRRGGTLSVSNSNIDSSNITVLNQPPFLPATANTVINSSTLNAQNSFLVNAAIGNLTFDGTGGTILSSAGNLRAGASSGGTLNLIGPTLNAGNGTLTLNANNATLTTTAVQLLGSTVNVDSPQSLDIASINSQNASLVSQGNITLSTTGNLSGGNFSFQTTNAMLERQSAGANLTPLAGNLNIQAGNIYGVNNGTAFSLVNASSVNVLVTGSNDAGRQLAGDLLLVNGATATVNKSIPAALVRVSGPGNTPPSSPTSHSPVTSSEGDSPLEQPQFRQQLNDSQQVTIIQALAQTNLALGNRSATSYSRAQDERLSLKYSDPYASGPFGENPFAVTLERIILLDPDLFKYDKLKIEGLDRAMSVMAAQEEQETWMIQYWRRFLERIILWSDTDSDS